MQYIETTATGSPPAQLHACPSRRIRLAHPRIAHQSVYSQLNEMRERSQMHTHVQGWNNLGWNNPDVRTPNLDELRGQGVALMQHYVYQ